MTTLNNEDPADPSVHEPERSLVWMPVLGHPVAIRAAVLEREQALVNHGQTLERLAERGGLSLSEAAALVLHRRYQPMSDEEAMAALKKAGQRMR